MAAAIFNFLGALLFLGLISQAYCQCESGEFGVGQSGTGKDVQGKPQWRVVITNKCVCTQMDIKLSCNGFQSVEPVDPSVLSKSGDECLINNGQPVYGHATFNFTYAWDNSIPLKPLSSRVACS